MIRKLILLVAAVLGLSVLLPTAPASAHATLMRSFPSHGQNFDNPPRTVQVEFNETISAAFAPLIVRNSQGERVDLNDAVIDPESENSVEVSLKPLPPGLYTAVYRVTSLDGHPVEGTIAFTVGGAVAIDDAPPQAPQTPRAVSIVHGLAQMLACLLAGLGAFLVLVAGSAPPRRIGRLALALVVLFSAVGLVEVSLYAVRASGDAWSPALLVQALVSTPVGKFWLIRLGLGVLTGAALAGVGRLKWLALALGLGLLLAFSMQSHATATGRDLPVYMDWLHMVAVSPWVGGLLGFALQPRSELVPRFSRVAMLSVIVLTATGVYGSLQQIPSWAALWTTTYGHSLLWKVGLLMPVLALAAYNLFKRGQGRFRLAVGAELALVFGIFLAAGFLTTLPPAGVELALRQGPLDVTSAVEGYTFTLHITPMRLGFNQATLTLTNPDGKPEAGASAGLRLIMLDHDMGTQNVDAKETAPGTYQVRDIVLGMWGNWRIEMVALTKGGRELRQAVTATVPAPP